MKNACVVLMVLFISAIDLHAADCQYLARPVNKDAEPEVTSHKDCGEVTDADVLKLNKSHFKRLDFSDQGLAWVWIDKKIFYVAKSGKSARMHVFDNGPDCFEEGRARTVRKNKFGFVNKNLDVVIEPKYDFAYPFTDGHAVVCNGCKPEPVGEHSIMAGGLWGIIDKKGAIVVPVSFKQGRLPGPAGYKKLIKGALSRAPGKKACSAAAKALYVR